MSAKHPVIAVTGSSGAGTTTTSLAFRKIFAQLNLHAAEVEGDSFHRYTRPEMDMAIRKARDQGKHISYFGPEANDFGLLEQTFVDYGRHGKGQSRKYLHTYDEAVPWNQVPTPQFSRTHINFQRVPTVDTSNPFAAKAIPSLDESFVVIHFRNLQNIDFPWLLAMLQGSFISHMNTLVVPGGKMGLAMELIMTPLVERLMEGRKIG